MSIEGAYSFDDVGNSTQALDLSGNGRHLTLTGTNGTQITGGTPGGALGKTGATMPIFPAALLTAIEVDDRAIMFSANGNLTTWWVRCQLDSINSGVWGILLTGGNLAVQARDNTASFNLATRPAAVQPGAAWHHYCATYKRSTGLIKIYKDGVLTTPGPPNGQSSFTAGTQMAVGASRLDCAEWSTTGAALDNLRFLSHCPDDPEVARLAATPVTGVRQSSFFAA